VVEKFFLRTDEERLAWDRFRGAQMTVRYVDSFSEQLEEWFQITHPALEPRSVVYQKTLEDFRQSEAAQDSVWVFYPWTNTAVRLLPPDAFFRVRTARNRNIISEEAQHQFAGMVVGIAGLSIGHTIAATLAQQGGAMNIVLADNDTLALSNTNRVHLPVTALGQNKAVLAARTILETNPYATVTLFSEGLNEENLERFLCGTTTLDAVVEVVDSFAVKVALREAARRLRIPVLMPTCMGERVLLDVERYDVDPARKVFVRTLSPDFFVRIQKPLSRQEWIQCATEIVGEEETVAEVAATNAAVGKTVTTRPLLGGTVDAAAALTVAALRKIATNTPLLDGRHRMDLTKTMNDTEAVTVSVSPASSSTRSLWDPVVWDQALRERPASYWQQRGERQVLRVFHRAAARVPAYKDFLKKQGVHPAAIRTIDDFARGVPEMDKENYLRQYPLASLCVDGNLGAVPMVSVSSGSTGKPFYWPRGATLTNEGAFVHEMIFRSIFGIGDAPTLAIVGFSMGAWIAGTYTTESIRQLALRPGAHINLMTPGIDVQDILPILQDHAASYRHIILTGYPPIVKDVIDAALAAGITFAPDQLRFLFAGEGFTEEWREALLTRVGAVDVNHASVNIYGTADAAVIGHETPLTIAVRRWISGVPGISEKIFGDERLPTLVQWHPGLKYCETNAHLEILFSSAGNFPLIRYNIHDVGGIVGYEDFFRQTKQAGFVAPARVASSKWQLPFLYLFGRKHLATTIYAVDIYLENIHAALSHPALRDVVSGKSVMGNAYDPRWDQYWWVRIEAARGVVATAKEEALAQQIIVKTLQEKNSEFRRLYSMVGPRVVPHVQFFSHGAPEFRIKTKLRWTDHTQSVTPPSPGESPRPVAVG
jgi:phenylacetate-CoA ligase